jgi:polyisoprenoid-binding protein YceI
VRRGARGAALVVATALLAAGTAAAGEQRLVLDPDRSEILFSLGATLHTVHGRLRLGSGEIRFDAQGGPASGQVVVDARSAETGIGARDRKMREKVLESERFPEISLRPERLEVLRREAERADVRLHGVLELYGSLHPIEIPARIETVGDDVRVDARFRVPYVDWGLRDVSTFLMRVDDYVDVEVHALGRLAPGTPRRSLGSPRKAR